MPSAFPEWRGAKLLGALAQGMYWFLVMRADLGVARGDLAALGRRIGAAPDRDGVAGFAHSGRPGPGARQYPHRSGAADPRSRTNFGLAAAEALERGEIDGFWANGMGAEIAVTSGIGTIVLDVRRGDGPPGCFFYTMPALVTTDRLIEDVAG